MNTKLFVGNLSAATTEEDLRWLFSTKGMVSSVELVKDNQTGKSKGFAYVEMISMGDAGKAVSEFNGYRLHDRKITVSAAKANKSGPRRKNNTQYSEYVSYNQSIRKR
jgi:cold-inducible RNA-binding protein